MLLIYMAKKMRATNKITEALLGAVKEDYEVDLQPHTEASGINYYIHQMLGRNQISVSEEIR